MPQALPPRLFALHAATCQACPAHAHLRLRLPLAHEPPPTPMPTRADDQTRQVEAHHYCSHPSAEVRQCLLFDSDQPGGWVGGGGWAGIHRVVGWVGGRVDEVSGWVAVFATVPVCLCLHARGGVHPSVAIFHFSSLQAPA